MNFLLFFNFCLISLNSVVFTEQLFHREGRFINFSINKYRTQLPSIHDVTHSLIHYRMPVAIFVPTVQLNLRSKQKRIQYASFPTTNKKTIDNLNQPDSQNKSPVINEQEAQLRSNEKQETILSPIVSRNGWVARSLIHPQKFKILKKNSLNYASTLPSESNLDLISFLYKDSLQSQSRSNLFNSQYQLTNSNPARMFSQNIAYIQPNSVASYQPNILVLSPSSQYELKKSFRNKSDQSVLIDNEEKNNSLPMTLTVPLTNNLAELNQSIINQSDSIDKLALKPSVLVNNSLYPDSSLSGKIDVGQNADEISDEHVQRNEPLENVSVSPVNDLADIELINSINNSINNASQLISNTFERRERQLNIQEIPSNPLSLYNSEQVLDPNAINLTKKLLPNVESYRSQTLSRIRPKSLISNRSQRSLIDLPSYAGIYTAAAALSGHSKKDRSQLFQTFLNTN